MKRQMQGGFMGGIPNKQPRMSIPPSLALKSLALKSSVAKTFLCRLCAQLSSFCAKLKDKPEILKSLK